MTIKTCGIKEAIKACVDDPLWKEKEINNKKEEQSTKSAPEKKSGNISYGTGLSATAYLSGARQLGHQSCAAVVRICEDGTVNLLTGATDCGQGSDTVLVMIAAEVLGISPDMIGFKMLDTDYTPVDAGSYGSRVTVLAGQAVRIAAEDAKKQLLEKLAESWNTKSDNLEIRNNSVYMKDKPEQKISFDKLAKIACYSGSGAVIIGSGYSNYGVEPLDFTQGKGNAGTTFSFTAQTTRLGVDMETGQVKVSDFLIAHDCGRPLNPIGAEGQNQGGAVQAMGQALYEDFIMENGRTLNPTFLDYKMPRSSDVPDIRVIDIITDDPDGPFGAKEASEGSHVSAPPSIVSALHDATGIWFKELPVTPEKIIKSLNERGVVY